MTQSIPSKNYRRLKMSRSRQRVSLSFATLYSLCILAVVPFHSAEDGTGIDSKIYSRLRGSTYKLSPGFENEKERRHAAIDMSSYSDDTTLEEVEELMEDDVEMDDDNNGSTPTAAPTTTKNTTADNLMDGFLGEILEDLTEAYVNVTNTTSDELFESMKETFFGSPDDNMKANSTESLDDVFEEVMTSIFGTNEDDPTIAYNTSSEDLGVQNQAPLRTQDDVLTTNFKEGDNPPIPPDATSNINNTDNTKEMNTDNHDVPESPELLTSSPIAAPRHRPTSSPTIYPTSERIDDFDLKDKETEKEDDDLFNEKSYSNNRSRPMGGGVPGSKFSFAVVLGILASIAGMIFTAWQMSDNPDGLFASLCRLTLTCIQLVFRIIMSPCRKYCGGYHNHHHLAGSNGYHEPYGHLPVSTMDYGYKDPSLELT